MKLSLTLLEGTFTIHRLEPDVELPKPALRSPFFAITRTNAELSLVLPDSVKIESDRSDPGWACFKVEGPLEFELVGVLAGISTALAAAGGPIFALSTFDTDYILVKQVQIQVARDAFSTAGFTVNEN